MFNITVTPDNGNPYEVSVSQRDVLKWEKADSSRSISRAQEEGLRLADLYELAYHASVRTNNFKGTQAKFENEHELEFEEADENPPS